MKLWLDDIRDPPDSSWRLARTYHEAVVALAGGTVDVVSLDHDLGEGATYAHALNPGSCEPHDGRTGYDVACWIEEAVLSGRIAPLKMRCHSANPSGRARIQQVIDKLGAGDR